MGKDLDTGGEPHTFARLEPLFQDLRLAARRLSRAPSFTAVATLTLALGIGANVALFAVVDAVLMRPLPYPEPERLLSLFETHVPGGGRDRPATVANLADYAVPALQGLAAYGFRSKDLTGAGTPETLAGTIVGASYFGVLGVAPALGRGFGPHDMQPGAEKVVIISHGLLQRRFGADPALLQRTIRLDGEAHRVVGILPRGFVPLAEIGRSVRVELHLPAAFPPEVLRNRGDHGINVVARLGRNATLKQAADQLLAVSVALGREHPLTNGNVRAALAPLQQDLAREVRGPLLLLLAAVCVVLLIACVNLANLMLARSLGRSREVAVRVALGAGRGRVVREVLAEACVVAVLAALLGVALAQGTLRLLLGLAPAGTPRLDAVAIDARVLLFALLAAAFTTLLSGLIPALHVSQVRPHESLKAAERGLLSGGGRRWGSALTVVEVALSLVLLLGGGLLLRSLLRLSAVPLGFETRRVLALAINLPQARYRDAASRLDFFERLAERAQGLPGVERVAFASQLPLRGSWGTTILVEGVLREGREARLGTEVQAVSPDYFATLGVRLLRGRPLRASDRDGTQPVAVVNQEFARQFLGSQEPLGRRLRRLPLIPWIEIVGVVSDLRRGGKVDELKPQLYLPAAQTGLYPTMRLSDLAVRTSGDPRTLARAVQAQVWALDPEQPINRVLTLAEAVDADLATRRFATALLAGFAGLALVLSLIGVYGVVAHAVSRRTAEIGLRMAVGARPGEILAMVLREASRRIGLGLVLGLLAAVALSRVLEGLLFAIAPLDPLTFATVPLCLGAIAAAATLAPALRASRVDPLTALRSE